MTSSARPDVIRSSSLDRGPSHPPRSCFQLEPKHDGGNRDHGQVFGGQLLIARGDATELLEAVDQPFHHVTVAIGRFVEVPSSPLVLLASNHYPDAPLAQIPPDLLAAIALVPRHPIGTDP